MDTFATNTNTWEHDPFGNERAPLNLQEDFLHLLQSSGLEGMARDSGLMPSHPLIMLDGTTKPPLGSAGDLAHMALVASSMGLPTPHAAAPRAPPSPAKPVAAPSHNVPVGRHMTIGSLGGVSAVPDMEGAASQLDMMRKAPVKRTASAARDDDEDSADSGQPGKKKGKRGRRGGGDKGGKGLRHFSMKVCQKVEEKGTTTYNEVADELVTEFTNPESAIQIEGGYDQKNIRRRVYDALNVLMAMGIISKEKREIKWLGLPTSSQEELDAKMAERDQKQQKLEKKKQHLVELVAQLVSMRNLVHRNKTLRTQYDAVDPKLKLMLPFIIINAKKDTDIECEMAEDRSEYFFNFNSPFEIHDDHEILKRMGMQFYLEETQRGPLMAELQHLLPQSVMDGAPPRGYPTAGSGRVPVDHHHAHHPPHHLPAGGHAAPPSPNSAGVAYRPGMGGFGGV